MLWLRFCISSGIVLKCFNWLTPGYTWSSALTVSVYFSKAGSKHPQRAERAGPMAIASRWPLFDFQRLGGTWNRRRLFSSLLTELGNVLINEREGRHLDSDHTEYSIIKDSFGKFFRSWHPSFLPGYGWLQENVHAHVDVDEMLGHKNADG
ncbi:uncharacterized protein ARMOST_18186 [Armillaria ostoyae]|uniref:Uncharacterized protein n=1 Tax=Armillaria ostoyae TaxID=47428 RepID=A0A284S141_ARMOS|nr:uncharacterized protein ARMOST_18186 [Armillaria ostoyae]